MKKIMTRLAILLCTLTLLACRGGRIFDPGATITQMLGNDTYHIPLKHIVRPDKGLRPVIKGGSDAKMYFFWPSGRGLRNSDVNPDVWERDLNIVQVRWSARNSGIVGADMSDRVEKTKRIDVRDESLDDFNLTAYQSVLNFNQSVPPEDQWFHIDYIGKIYGTPMTVRCLSSSVKLSEEAICQFDYVHPKYNQHIYLEIYGKNMRYWEAINKMAMNYLESWYVEGG